MTAVGVAWYDESAGPLVRPYTVTGGRTRPGRADLDLATLVVAVDSDTWVDPEHVEVLRVCADPVSVAEVAATLDLPLGVAKVVISDLLDRGLLSCRSGWHPVTPDLDMLRKVLDGIRNL